VALRGCGDSWRVAILLDVEFSESLSEFRVQNSFYIEMKACRVSGSGTPFTSRCELWRKQSFNDGEDVGDDSLDVRSARSW
jgi:hypothetical protein